MRRERPKGRQRRALILEIARNILIEDGYDAFIVREIAERAGITLGNLQYYFPTREDLIEAVARAELARTLTTIRAIESAGGSGTARLERLARALVREWQREGGKVYVVSSLLALHHPRFRKLHREIYEEFYDALCALLADLRPDADRADLLHQARLATSLLDGAVYQIPLEKGRDRKADMKRFVDELAQGVVRLVDA